MNKTLLGIAVCVATPFASAADQAESASEPLVAQQISRIGSQASAAGPADYFSGRVRVDPLFPASSQINASGAYITFEPGARSAWHTHDRAAAKRAFDAMMGMRKIDIAAIEAALER